MIIRAAAPARPVVFAHRGVLVSEDTDLAAGMPCKETLFADPGRVAWAPVACNRRQDGCEAAVSASDSVSCSRDLSKSS